MWHLVLLIFAPWNFTYLFFWLILSCAQLFCIRLLHRFLSFYQTLTSSKFTFQPCSLSSHLPLGDSPTFSSLPLVCNWFLNLQLQPWTLLTSAPDKLNSASSKLYFHKQRIPSVFSISITETHFTSLKFGSCSWFRALFQPLHFIDHQALWKLSSQTVLSLPSPL